MKKEIEEMNKAVRCLALELPEQVFLDFFGRWTTFRDSLLTPSADVQERAKEYVVNNWERMIDGEYSIQQVIGESYLAGHAGASSGMQWVKWSVRIPEDWESKINRLIGDTFSIDNSLFDHREDALCKIGGTGRAEYHQLEWLDESSPSSMQEENERLRDTLRQSVDEMKYLLTEVNKYAPGSYRAETTIVRATEALNKQQ